MTYLVAMLLNVGYFFGGFPAAECERHEAEQRALVLGSQIEWRCVKKDELASIKWARR